MDAYTAARIAAGLPGAFTTLAASGAVSGVGFSNYLLAPLPIGPTTPSTGAFTTLSASGLTTLVAVNSSGNIQETGGVQTVVDLASAIPTNGIFLSNAGADRRAQEMFVPLEHPPGHAQVDFGEAIGIIGGVERKI
jgi:hypothetical protein